MSNLIHLLQRFIDPSISLPRLRRRGSILQPMWAAPALDAGANAYGGDDSGKANPCSACVGRARQQN